MGLLAAAGFHDFGLTLEAFSQTVAITVLATIYSVLLGLVLAAFGARNLMKIKPGFEDFVFISNFGKNISRIMVSISSKNWQPG